MPPPEHQSLLTTLLRHYEDLMAHVRRRFAGRGLARDAVHDLCLQLLEHPSRTTAAQPLAFLRRASLYRAIDRQRSDAAYRAPLVALDDLLEPPSHEVDGFRALHISQQIEALRLAIDGLPPRCRQVFLLHRLHDMTQEEIATAIGISRNMVARHVARAMQDLRPLLGAEPGPRRPGAAADIHVNVASPREADL